MKKELFISENYIREERKYNPVHANIAAIVILIFALIIFGLPFYFIWPEKLPNFKALTELKYLDRLKNGLPLILIMIIGIIIHEMIHAIFAVAFLKKSFKSINFKFKYGILICQCNGIFKISEYKMVLLMPLIIMWIIPAIISLFIGNYFLLIFGIIFITLAGGDIFISYLLLIKLKLKNNYCLEGHPTDPTIGIIYRPKNYLWFWLLLFVKHFANNRPSIFFASISIHIFTSIFLNCNFSLYSKKNLNFHI